MLFESLVLISLLILSLGAIYRIIRGPTIWDRMLGVSLFSAKVIVAMVLLGVIIDRTYMIDVALVFSVLGFISTVIISRFVERKGDI